MKELVLVGAGGFVGDSLRYITSAYLIQFAAIGNLGGFTTFSAFGLNSFELLKAGQFKMTILYVLNNMLVSLLSVGLGLTISSN